MALVGCGGGGGATVTAQRIETKVQPALQQQLRELGDDDSILVEHIDCVKKNASDATCIAHVSDSVDTAATIKIGVDIDPDTGKVIWQVTSAAEGP